MATIRERACFSSAIRVWVIIIMLLWLQEFANDALNEIFAESDGSLEDCIHAAEKVGAAPTHIVFESTLPKSPTF